MPQGDEADVFFGEGASTVVLSAADDEVEKLRELFSGIEFAAIGRVTSAARLRIAEADRRGRPRVEADSRTGDAQEACRKWMKSVRENSRRSLRSFLWKSSPRSPTSTPSTRNAASSASTAIPRPPISSTWACTRLQHRGQESAGIVSSNGKSLISHRGMGLVADIFSSDVINRLEGTARHRPQPLFHHRLDLAQELPAAGGRVRGRRIGARAQRQPGELRRTARAARDQRLAVSIILGQRSDHSSDRGVARADAGRARGRGAGAGARRLLAGGADRARDDRGARPVRLSSAGAGIAQRRADRGVGNLRAGPGARRLPARSRAGRDGGDQRRRNAVAASVPARADQALHLRVRLLLAARQPALRAQRLPGAQAAGARAGARMPGRRRHRRAGARLGQRRRARAMPKNRGCRSRWGWCAATTSAAPLSSRASRFATSGSR